MKIRNLYIGSIYLIESGYTKKGISKRKLKEFLKQLDENSENEER